MTTHKNCPTCGRRLYVEVPLTDEVDALYRDRLELRGKQKTALTRAVQGALEDDIRCHGTVTSVLAYSAAKRIAGQVLTWLHNQRQGAPT